MKVTIFTPVYNRANLIEKLKTLLLIKLSKISSG